jgi:hypothetical protein
MAGFNHDFLLLSNQEHSYTDYLRWINNPQAIQIHDDMVHYIQDTLNWIPCYNPARNMIQHKGLNLYGPTVIKSDGAIRAEKVFMAWIALFSNGPKEIQLTGCHEWNEGENKAAGQYSVIKIDRDEIVKRFTALALIARKVAASKDNLFILHLGI